MSPIRLTIFGLIRVWRPSINVCLGWTREDGQDVDLTKEKIRLLEKVHSCFRERKLDNPYPGDYLFILETLKGGYLRGLEVDLYSGCGRYVWFPLPWAVYTSKTARDSG